MKRIIAALALALFTLTAVGCGGGTSTLVTTKKAP